MTAGSLLFFQDAAFAAPPNLSSVFLADSLPGFAVEAPGPTNGPIDESNLKYLGMSASAASSMGKQIANGNVSGFIRTWAHSPANGDGVIISAFWFQKAIDLSEFAGGEANGAQRESGVPFTLPGVPGALGYSIEEANTQVFVVLFTTDETAFQVDVINATHDLTSSDAASLARQQLANIPGSVPTPGVTPSPGAVQSPGSAQSPGATRSSGTTPSSSAAKGRGVLHTPVAGPSPSAPQTFGAVPVAAGASQSSPGGSAAYDAGKDVGAVLLTVLMGAGVVILVRRLRRMRRAPNGIPAAAAVTAIADSAPQPERAAGWYPVGTGSDQQDYWDGEAWVARMRWTGDTWVDVPAHSPVNEAHESVSQLGGTYVAANLGGSEAPGAGPTELEVCVWQDAGCRSDRVVEPSDSAIRDAIHQLDGDTRNDLYIRAVGGPWMGVAGGPDRVIVTFADGEEGPFFQAVTSPNQDGEDVQVCVAGQPLWMPARTLVNEEDAIAAAIEFARSAERPLSLAWSP